MSNQSQSTASVSPSTPRPGDDAISALPTPPELLETAVTPKGLDESPDTSGHPPDASGGLTEGRSSRWKRRLARFRGRDRGWWLRLFCWLSVISVAVYFFLCPSLIVLTDMTDSYDNDDIPERAFKMHRSLSPQFATWASQRVASGVARDVGLYDIAGTEWPVFSAAFYLWATQRMQHFWQSHRWYKLQHPSPLSYARPAIEAARKLLLDKNHHSWVRRHWGKQYMTRKNVFFRSLLIGGLTSYEKLMRNGKDKELLRRQVVSLASSLDRSKYGVLDDYPGECYPIDVLAAIGILKEAGELLKIDQKAFLKRALRAFSGNKLDRHGLPRYRVVEDSYAEIQPSRGIGNSHSLIFAAGMWPKQAVIWYERYTRHFWQERWWVHGFREYAKGIAGHQWYFDIDAGPVIDGFSTSGSAFGIAAARRNGRFDHAYTLSIQALAVSWPLPDGTLLGPRLLSAGAGAPYLGESAILFFLSTRPAKGVKYVKGGTVTPLVWMILAFWLITGLGLSVLAARKVRTLVQM